ncbi:MAG: hypothetical protein MI741_13630, partial [Rhodospirillales bacterium]|nr:hypothetical protein [Rhodospirillales bacterium]
AEQARDLPRAIDRQTAELEEASREAGDITNALRERAGQVAVDDFLKRATFISERLQSIAVDMNRIMETTISEEDWRRFTRGETGIFVRKMLGFREKAKLAAIRDKHRDDGEFRDYVGRYLAQFEALLQDAKKSDQKSVLSTTFLSSDMGKLYMLLTRALDRDI